MPTSLLSQLSTPESAAVIGILGLLLGLLGFPLTVWGLRLTYVQASKASSAAEAAESAVSKFRIKLDHYEAYRDLIEAGQAVEATTKFLKSGSWQEAAEYYEIARRAIMRLQSGSLTLDGNLQLRLREIAQHMASFCNKVDAARAGKGGLPNASKVLAIIRNHFDTLTEVQVFLQKEMM